MLTILIASLTTCTQKEVKEEVLKKLEEYQITTETLTRNLKDANAEHYFDLKTTTIKGTMTRVVESTFDPSKNTGERWMLLSVDQNSPSAKDLTDFDKYNNTKRRGLNGKIDESSWKIEKDDEATLVISFKIDKKTLPKKYSFLGHCKGSFFFNKKTEQLEKAEFVNEQPLKIRIYDVTRLDMFVYYEYQESEGIYLIRREELDMEATILGQPVQIKETNEYRNYRRVE